MPSIILVEDEYNFVNPYAAEYDKKGSIVTAAVGSWYHDFSSLEWDVELTVTARRKVRVPEIGSVWRWKQSGTLLLQVIGIVKHNGSTFVAAKAKSDDSLFLEELRTFVTDHEEVQS